MCTFSLSATSMQVPPYPPPSSFFSSPSLPLTTPHSYTFTSTAPKPRLPVFSATKDIWRNPKTTPSSPPSHPPRHRRKLQGTAFLDHTIDMDELAASIRATQNDHDLNSLLSPYKSRSLSIRFMVSLLSREPDWRRSLAILDWINDVALYTPSVFAYNVVLRNVLRAGQWDLAHGLFDEMRHRALSPDRYTYSTLITAFGKAGMFDAALSWLQKMEQDRVSGDLVLYSNLIELSRKLRDYTKAIAIFSRLKRMGIVPDLVAFNSMINVFGKAKLFREARGLLKEMRAVGASYSTLLTMYVENEKFLEALGVFREMNEVKCGLDITTCNVMIDVYGQLDMAKEADRLFWSMRKMGIEPNVVSYNTLLRVYGDAELFGEAIHLFRMMQRMDVEQNVVTYNTMIRIYGKSLEHEKAMNLVQEMQKRGIQPNAITYYIYMGQGREIGQGLLRVKPLEVRRIFTMGLPFTSHHAGQILFGPKDGYLYFMMGDGGSIVDPYNFSQNKKSLLGKIMRFDIDNLPSAFSISDLGLWGNYYVPADNPFSDDKELQPEIWALGLRNPWRCSFDLERPSYFLCADVGQDQYEEVDIVTKGGNFGWRAYEGASPYHPPKSPGGNTFTSSINPIFPVMGYNHSDVNKAEGSASITGGYFYRSMTDPCMYGRYIYADLYAGRIWAGTETPEYSGNFTSTLVPVSCALDSPMQCSAEAGSSVPALGFIFSFGQDNRKDMFILTSTGVYRVARPSRCNYTCSKENATSFAHPGSIPSPSASASNDRKLNNPVVVELLLVYFFMSLLFGS